MCLMGYEKGAPVFSDEFDICNAASTTDCTGLIQIPPQSEAEADSYREIMNYTPPKPQTPKKDNPAEK